MAGIDLKCAAKGFVQIKGKGLVQVLYERARAQSAWGGRTGPRRAEPGASRFVDDIRGSNPRALVQSAWGARFRRDAAR